MAVLGRLLIGSGERLDLPDLLSIDSYTAGDFKFLLKGLVGDSTPYVLRGFDVIDPQNAIGTQGCSIRVANSVVFYPGSNAGSFFHGLEDGNALAAPLVPELRKNAVNYVYLTFSTTNSSVDTRAFWDPDKDGGAGGEFTQDINTESVLRVDVNVSVGSFPQNTIPIAKITVGPVVITAIEDARDMLFRLGTGGISPNPFNAYAWRSFPSTPYQRTEPPTKMLAGGVNPFQGADKNIYTLKEWMDVIMSKLKELGGTTYWYEDASTFSLISGFIDAAASAFKSKGKWIHDYSTPGLLTWTEDINIKSAADLRTYIIRSGSKTILDEQVMYLPMVRKEKFNAGDDVVDWINGQPYVNTVGGVVGLFANLQKGDYVKKINDSNDKFLRVEEFYDSINLSGSTTTPALAKSIRLSGNYLGTTLAEKGRYDKGVYDVADVVVSDRDQMAITSSGGNFHWMALRSDTIQDVSSIVTTTLSLDIEEHDGKTAKVTSSTPHNLIDGDRITIIGSTNYNDTYVVEVEDSTIFYINRVASSLPDELGVTGLYATITTAARSTLYGLQLESAQHNFDTNDTISISDTVNYDGSYQISVKSSTEFTIPISSALASESIGTATLARTIVRTEGSVLQIVQGGTATIGGDPANSIRQFIGMQSLSESNPSYAVPPSYNTLDGFANYNSTINESLTARVSKLTSMMADKAQDKTIRALSSGYYNISNITNALYQQISFSAEYSSTPTLDIAIPGSNTTCTITLTGTLSLLANQVAYFSIDRNSPASYATLATLTVSNIEEVPVDENIFIFAYRLMSGDVWLWDGYRLPVDYYLPTPQWRNQLVRQNNTSALIKGGMWTWDLSTNSLSWSSDAYIQVQNQDNNRNTIIAQSIVLPSDGYVAYVDINRIAPGGAANLTPIISTINNIVSSDNNFIIARRIDNEIIVGNNEMLLVHGDSKALNFDDSVIRVKAVDAINVTPPGSFSGISLSYTSLPISTIGYLSDTTSTAWANKIILSTATNISSVQFKLGNYGGPSGDIFVEIQADIGGFPSGIALATSNTVNANTLPNDPITVDQSFSISASLSVGTYWIVLKTSIAFQASSDLFNRVQVYLVNLLGEITYNLIPSGWAAYGPDLIVAYNVYGSTSGASFIDGVSISDGDKVLFTKNNGIWMVDNLSTSPTWTQLKSFSGSTTPYDGALVSAQSGSSGFRTLWQYSQGVWAQVEHTKITKEPTGFPNRTDSTLSFVNSTRTFTISPSSSYFDIYQKGVPYRFNTAQNIAIPDLEGLHYIYFNNGALVTTQTFDINIIKEYVFVSTIQWDAANNVRIMFGDERHGLTMDGETHSYLHQAVGARYINGLSAGNFTTSGSGSSNSDAQISISNGVVRDEDISFNYTHSSSPVLPFEQILSPIANIPIYYRSGINGDWRKDTATAYPLKQGSSRIKWNNPAGPWTTPDATSDDNFVAVWIFSTNSQEQPIIGIVGQREDTTLNDAQANNTYESILFGSLPSLEMKVLYRLIFQTSSAYTNTPKAKLVDVRDLRRAVDVSLGAYAPSDHGLLTGLTDQDHPDFSIFVNNPSTYVGGLKQLSPTDNDDVEKALNSLDRFFAQMRLTPHPSDGNRVVMSGADQALTNGTTLTQNIKNLMISFDGAQIDFSTGSIYKADGITALGINFVPATISSNQYRWYSISAVASSVNSDNTIGLQLIVLEATNDGVSAALAPKAAYAKGIQVGSVVIRDNGSGGIVPITAASIKQLGTGGSGSGSGDGDANELLERLKDRLLDSPFEWADPNIFLTDEDDKISSATATFDVANTLYKYTAAGQNVISVQSLDPEFLTEEKDVTSVELMAFWNQGYVDSNAVYEVSRNGGINWNTINMSRVGTTTDTFRGIISFPQDTTYATLYEHALVNANSYLLLDTNAGIEVAYAQKFIISSGEEKVLQKSILYINKTEVSGTVGGNVYVQIIKDNGAGLPSTNIGDIVCQNVVSSYSLSTGNNSITINHGTFVLKAGTYHYVISTDDAYKSSFNITLRNLRVLIDSVLPIGTYNMSALDALSGLWQPRPSFTMIHKIEGRPLDLIIRITSSTSNVQLKGYGVLYSRHTQVVTGIRSREVVTFDGSIDNLNEFILTNFLPDPDTLKIYHVETGQVYVRGVNSFYLDGHKIVFPANTFNGLDTVTLVFDQSEGSSFDNSDDNRALLAANFLGSTDPAIDRSQPGRGILLRRPDGTLREITIDDLDQIVIYSV